MTSETFSRKTVSDGTSSEHLETEKRPPTPLSFVDPERSWVTIEVTVERLVEPTTSSQQQIGIIEDETGKAKLIIWSGSGQDVVLDEGDVIRMEHAMPGYHQKALTLSTVTKTDIFVFENGTGPASVE